MAGAIIKTNVRFSGVALFDVPDARRVALREREPEETDLIPGECTMLHADPR